MRHRRFLLTTILLCTSLSPALASPMNVCMISGSFEYDSDTSLAMFKEYLEQNFDVNCQLLKADGWENILGLEALDTCDTALFFTRRLELNGEQLDRIKNYCRSGRPIVAVRTASHGFQRWLAFDKEVLGGNYQGIRSVSIPLQSVQNGARGEGCDRVDDGPHPRLRKTSTPDLDT